MLEEFTSTEPMGSEMPASGGLIALGDLTVVGDEPRIRDLLLAERLGFTDSHKVRTLIERNRIELAGYGEVSATAAETGAKGGRPGKEYWLNEGQALIICALSRTPQAAAVRKQIVDVFLAYRRGQIGSPLSMKAIGGMYKKFMQRQQEQNDQRFADLERQMAALHPLIAAAQASADSRAAVIACKSVKQLLTEGGALPRGRRSLNLRMGYMLRSAAMQQGVTLYRDLHSNVWVFPVAFVEQFMQMAGRQMIREHNDLAAGQGVFHFNPKRRRGPKLKVVEGGEGVSA